VSGYKDVQNDWPQHSDSHYDVGLRAVDDAAVPTTRISSSPPPPPDPVSSSSLVPPAATADIGIVSLDDAWKTLTADAEASNGKYRRDHCYLPLLLKPL